MTAVDLQLNNITNISGASIPQVLETNSQIVIFDVRNNSIGEFLSNGRRKNNVSHPSNTGKK